ncbi:DUF4147 domain-containing protein [Alphaproteobacteria bacterium KMM 3653]|uniref:DUF4147 domain-containing protein n=1 Tax=Harenicola maris TaxID=2841044 RepID=A0AAP2CMT5_9RHOB|nr:DUF4147 domain-containing protein [Harenicola maris]
MSQNQAIRDRARAIFDAGVAAANPETGVEAYFQSHPLPQARRRVVLAVGKAAVPMARAALAALPAPDLCLVITNPENAVDLPGAEVFAAAHPVPDAIGHGAAERVWQEAGALEAGDHLIVLVSGGGSALMPLPAEGMSLEDKMTVNAALLASGADITEMNLVRQQLSRLKGGGLSRRAAPALVTSLILSDVVGDDLRVIASGPTATPIGTSAQALAALEARGIAEHCPEAALEVLRRGGSGAEAGPAAQNHLTGSNAVSVAAMASVAGEEAVVADVPLEGDVEDAARHVLAVGAAGPGVYLFGGETTVTLRGTGRGGRNQHMALRLAQLAQEAGWSGDWCFLSGGTDGRDGPTDAAGGLVDGGTMARAQAAGADVAALLENNDSYAGLAATGDLLMTGGTGTNVADLQVLIRV